jgi:hypothetical protein
MFAAQPSSSSSYSQASTQKSSEEISQSKIIHEENLEIQVENLEVQVKSKLSD